jgi:Na+-driven multidrug efflux pump
MGCSGAATATVISEAVQILILALAFFSRKNRTVYKTFENRQFNGALFRECMKIGAPLSISNFVSMIAWYVVQTAVSHASKDVATIYNIGTNIYIFFLFTGEGINKAIAAICSNMIGRGDIESIEKTRKIFVVISILFGLITAIPLIVFPEWILGLLDILPDNISALYSDIKIVFYLVTATSVLETLLLATWGILMAGGDTKYSTAVYQICLWGLLVLPTSIIYYADRLTSVPLVYGFIIAWLIVTQFFLYRRYKSMKWYRKLV